MDFALFNQVFTTFLGIATLAVAVFALEEGRRTALLSRVKSWGAKVLMWGVLINSAVGVYQFLVGPGAASRWQTVVLAIHILNALAMGFIAFMIDIAKALEERKAKRAALQKTVDDLQARLERLELP